MVNNEKQLHRGFISDIYEDSAGMPLYYIHYEDDDTEDMSVEECLKAITLHKKLENGEINEWEIGEECTRPRVCEDPSHPRLDVVLKM